MTDLSGRLRVIGAARRLIADQAIAFAEASARPQASTADILVSEVMPLLAAARYLERRAAGILAPRRPGGRPLWLFGTRLLVRRVPLGRVLVVGPSNYPLLLPGVQVLQALAAGNVVSVKPAPGCSAPMRALRDALRESGIAGDALTVLAEPAESVRAALAGGVDHVVLTGSASTGRAVAADLATYLVPATMELSGRDPMIVLDGADIQLATRAAAFGLGLNGGRTCIAPRRIIVAAPIAEAFAAQLAALLADAAPVLMPPDIQARVAAITGVREASMRPAVLRAAPDAAWVHEDIFAPLAALHVAASEADAVRLANAGPYALGASVFGPAPAARRVATELRAGCVVVNDMIVPTAHPGLPFGGSGASGFGVTRGAEGLLAMTRPQAVMERTRPSLRHLTTLSPGAAPLIAALLRLAYGRPRGRAARDAIGALFKPPK